MARLLELTCRREEPCRGEHRSGVLSYLSNGDRDGATMKTCLPLLDIISDAV